MSGNALQVSIVFNKNNSYGLLKDANLLSAALSVAGRQAGHRIGTVKLVDAREPPTVCDICIHLEVPYAVWFPWARMNVAMVNSEWWVEDKWAGYKNQFDAFLFRDTKSMESFGDVGDSTKILVPWVGSMTEAKKKVSGNSRAGFLWLLGGSPNKRAVADKLLPLWKSSYPPVTVCSTEPLELDSSILSSNVSLRTGFLKEAEKEAMMAAHSGHICASKAESFGYAAAEAWDMGAFLVLTELPCFVETYKGEDGIFFLPNLESNIGEKLDEMMSQFFNTEFKEIALKRQSIFKERKDKFLTGLGEVVRVCVEAKEVREVLPKHMPPLLNQADCPPISIITLVHNRPKFIENACLNLLSTDYPKDKIEWVVVDDSDPDKSPSNRVLQFAEKFAPGTIQYIPLTRKHSIGFKRNLGIEKAKNDILLMMDDDDHYPSTSFRRRVAYLLKARRRYECATCTTIAMYDLLKGTSAVNVPPYNLSLGERCSEATLTFTRDFWKQRKFPEVSMAEGEGFLKGRESQVAEIPPQQIIVALNHKDNVGSRKIPDAQPSCFWGFPRELLEFLHGLVGIQVEAA
jgi:hypothetical protein